MENEHQCLNQEEITEMMVHMKFISKEFYGNGKEGLVKTIPRIEEKMIVLQTTVNSQTQLISDLTTTVSNLAEKVSSITAVEDYKKQTNTGNWTKISIILATLLGLASLLVAFIK